MPLHLIPVNSLISISIHIFTSQDGDSNAWQVDGALGRVVPQPSEVWTEQRRDKGHQQKNARNNERERIDGNGKGHRSSVIYPKGSFLQLYCDAIISP